MMDAELLAKAVGAVEALIISNLDATDKRPDFKTYIVWFSKTLQNWKALVSTTLPDLRYYEVTYNGDKREMYIDTYTKIANMVIPDDQPRLDIHIPPASAAIIKNYPVGDKDRYNSPGLLESLGVKPVEGKFEGNLDG
jgi:uncharacterized protein DUF6275